MTAAKSFKTFKACLSKRLEKIGFGAEGKVLSRKVRDTVVVLEVQRDSTRSTKDAVLFTLNLGISVDALRVDATDGDPSMLPVPTVDRCHWRERVGRLLPAQRDVWWTVRDEPTAQALCDEISTGLIELALPTIDNVAGSEMLLRLWKEGRGQGLTEYERRSNLAWLLCSLNRAEEAKAAIQALEEASRGKSWETSAQFTVGELRKQLG